MEGGEWRSNRIAPFSIAWMCTHWNAEHYGGNLYWGCKQIAMSERATVLQYQRLPSKSLAVCHQWIYGGSFCFRDIAKITRSLFFHKNTLWKKYTLEVVVWMLLVMAFRKYITSRGLRTLCYGGYGPVTPVEIWTWYGRTDQWNILHI